MAQHNMLISVNALQIYSIYCLFVYSSFCVTFVSKFPLKSSTKKYLEREREGVGLRAGQPSPVRLRFCLYSL